MSMDIKNIDGSVLLSVIPDDNAISHEELMTSDYIQIAWQSDENIQIPAGAYIEHEGEKYRILEPYDPTQQDECTYNYNPQFKSRVMAWDKQITPVYTYEDDGTTVKSRDMDWDFTGSPADAMYIVKQAIKNETGEEWTVQLSDSLPATITISSQSASIFAVLNSISSECETEWWADRKTNTLYLSKCIFGDPITLEVGNNVNVPTVQSDNKGYYTRFYAFGSSRNIVQGASQGSAVINNRLTLNPAKYPNGYKDIREGLKKDEIFPTTLYFDEIYPSSKLTISDVRARLRYRLDNAGQRIQIGGTEEKPIYEQYAIWYFQIADFTFDPTTVIEGKNLSVSFESGQLASRDFELTYHEKAETVSDANDVTPFEIKAGDYEITIDETSGQIIPGVAYIIPQNGDMIILYNIEMPAEYTASAQEELEKELDKAIALQIEDTNSYQFTSDPTRFYTDEIEVKMGQSVTFKNGEKTLSTRAMMVEKRLDYPCYKTIKVGNKIIKGNTQQLKDEVASVNQNIDVIKAFNDLSASLSQAYANAQREMIEGFAAIKNLWQLKDDGKGNKYAYTEYDILSHGGITQYSAGQAQVPTIWEGIPFDNKTIWFNSETKVVEVIGGTGGSDLDVKQMWAALAANTTEQINKSHLTTALSEYATTDSVSTLQTEITKKWTQDDAKIKNWDTAFGWGNHAEAGYAHLANEETFTELKHFTAGLSVGAGKHKLYEKDGVVYLDGDLAVTGGITQYALGDTPVSTIMDGVATDNVTIKKENGKLVVIGGGGSSFDSAEMWKLLEADTTEQINRSHLTTALQGYATESWANSNFPTKLGNGASGTWGIDISGTANYASRLNPAYGIIGSLDTLGDNTICSWNSGTNSKPSPYGTIFQFSNVKKPLPGTSEHWINQIAYGTNERIYVRQRINNGSWTTWRTLAYISDTIPQAENSNKLQNLTWSDFFSRKYHYIDYGEQSTSNFYPIFFFPSDIELDCEIHSDNVDAANAYNQNRIHFQLTAQGWSDAGVSFRILSRNNYTDSEITIGAIGYGDKDGGIAIWVRGGKRYRLYCNKTPYMKTSDFTYGSNGEKYTVGTNLDGGTNSFVNIIWKNDLNRNNGLVATVDGNVYSATKLQNTRTIWGQNFNGEQNVDGNIENTQSVKSKSGVWLDLFGNAGIGFYTANALRGVITQNGNFGIGTEAPLQKLHVAGNILATGDVETANGVFSTSNNTILRKWGFSNVNILSWNWDGTYGDHLTFNIPGTNDQSIWARLSSSKGFYVSGNIESTNGLKGVYLNLSDTYSTAISDSNKLNSGTLDLINLRYLNHDTCARILTWKDTVNEYGYITSYAIGSARPRSSEWGRMYIAVGNNDAGSSIGAQIELWGKGQVMVTGNFLATGGITQYSDQRAKTIIEQINLPLMDIANSPAIRFKWNGWKQKDDGKTHIGGIAQYVQTILPEAIYNSDDVLTMDYATTGYIFAVQTAKHLLSYETKTDKEIKQLKKRVKYLEKQLKKLGYEEIGTLDN